ncbi:hypothetical protein PAXRUDRAFT_17110 [Paxillus rubicundulus Ve08.2h10]|uniref:Uncharacterized protein n=1 Tax=Paxillus rubicundulus Ve08.2h10 TaxID=930991 RepID=A0A0D0CRN8_9AGAM|nr:hypothetical protein PAXRUDRAFT_17110 [Paxillus rubicundulus Ve08.2h10]
MSFPHRQELLDYQMNDSNFQAMISMARALKRKLRVAMAGVDDALAKLELIRSEACLIGNVFDFKACFWVNKEYSTITSGRKCLGGSDTV